jgi:ubiquitin-conjugating enzyme E2 variant
VSTDRRALPVHYELTRGQLLFSLASIASAFGLLAALAWRVASQPQLRNWRALPLVAIGVLAADFASGVVHWGADTWGRDDLPLVGPRLLLPFRVHHVNPDDFLRRRFVDTNGEVAFIAIPVLLALLALPLDRGWGGATAIVGLGFCGVGSMTNQIHQWAHMQSPPRLVRWMQGRGILLGRRAHAAHHCRPYDGHYCITTGWCNRPLEAIGFFRRLEAAIVAVAGIRPRDDDRRYEEEYGRGDAETRCA